MKTEKGGMKGNISPGTPSDKQEDSAVDASHRSLGFTNQRGHTLDQGQF